MLTHPLYDEFKQSISHIRIRNGGTDARCGLRIVTLNGHKTAILSEMPATAGRPARATADRFATLVLAEILTYVDNASLRFIEHRPPGPDGGGETLDFLHFDYNPKTGRYSNPRRTPLTGADIDALRAALSSDPD
jgi:hypothetical protein